MIISAFFLQSLSMSEHLFSQLVVCWKKNSFHWKGQGGVQFKFGSDGFLHNEKWASIIIVWTSCHIHVKFLRTICAVLSVDMKTLDTTIQIVKFKKKIRWNCNYHEMIGYSLMLVSEVRLSITIVSVISI
jgi:hypothetical protein